MIKLEGFWNEQDSITSNMNIVLSTVHDFKYFDLIAVVPLEFLSSLLAGFELCQIVFNHDFLEKLFLRWAVVIE